MSAILAPAMAGLDVSAKRLAIRAQNIANLNTDGYAPLTPVQTASAAGPVLRVERLIPERPGLWPQTGDEARFRALETEMVDMAVSRTAYKAAALLLRTARDADQTLLDMIA